ncbi:MAG: molybdopterin molybdotransferase MoeA [Gammaproteobacteria bacterium]|nr:molybdopterin molybdotransferase MoeA [Gammaproteobacteria bacterium]
MSGCGCDDLKENKLTPFDEAIDTLLDSASPLTDIDEVPTEDGLGRVLAHPLVSTVNVPPLDNSAMDGYAVASVDVDVAGTTLPVSQRICAGEVGEPLQAGTAARIFTGAPVPPNADAIVMQEMCDRQDDDVTINEVVKAGQHVRKAGEDIANGDAILNPGTRLRAQELGLAASIGCSPLSVYRRLKVGLFFTGDELVEPGNELKPGQIYDSNRYSLLGLLQTLGCEVVDLGIVSDDLESTKQALQSAAGQADLVITSGGVSVGEEDHVRIALEQLGKLNMWRIAMKPGKPLAFGHVGDTPFIGLPGNPVSAFVTFCLFVSPFIKKMQGMTRVLPASLQIKSAFDWPRPGKRLEFLRARLSQDGSGNTQAELFGHQGSGVLTSTSWADGLVIVPIGATVSPGDSVEYLSFTELL